MSTQRETCYLLGIFTGANVALAIATLVDHRDPRWIAPFALAALLCFMSYRSQGD